MFCKFKKVLAVFLLFSFAVSFSFGESHTPEPYNQDEIPESLQDLRRFEIISLGALPFVMLDTTLVYSTADWAFSGFAADKGPTAFASSKRFSGDEQMGLTLTSLGISLGVGLTDYIVRLIKRNSDMRKQDRNKDQINIIPVSEDPDAVPLPKRGD